MKILLSNLIIIITLTLYFLNNPLSMGLMILIQTLFICLISGMMINTYWFSYILFLTFLGGLLVMFIYVSSIASNELFKISMNNLIIIFLMMMTFFIIMIFMFYNNLKFLNLSMNLEMMNLMYEYNFFFNNENKLNLSKLYNNQNFFLMLMLISYLFITLLSVVKISNIFYGPLRT
uniref:NADH-ubiquinone oxidoreductase chain 6 n=1 Tax=Dahlica ochrostigma TaxID=2093356 RepID=A0A6H1XJT3_9NEOP|nr:NADH dehydrogenase subunit 6 [Dahlica ochrostigma]QJA15905.1 NADH dehydrogenase subunit 6 [Dahlica ochrostigma]